MSGPERRESKLESLRERESLKCTYDDDNDDEDEDDDDDEGDDDNDDDGDFNDEDNDDYDDDDLLKLLSLPCPPSE